MNYIKSQSYNSYMNMIMGPNPLKLTEELMTANETPSGSTVMDLGSGQGLTSVFLAKEYGFKVYAADLWSDPKENRRFFDSTGLDESQIIPVKADAENLHFEKEFFDAVVSVDSYNYFGRDKNYLDKKLLPYVKNGGYIYIAIPGMKEDYHSNLPKELLLSWTEEQLLYMQDIEYWRGIASNSKMSRIVSIKEMESNDEVWQDWLKQDNEYAKGDRASVEAGALNYLNFISIVLQKL